MDFINHLTSHSNNIKRVMTVRILNNSRNERKIFCYMTVKNILASIKIVISIKTAVMGLHLQLCGNNTVDPEAEFNSINIIRPCDSKMRF